MKTIKLVIWILAINGWLISQAQHTFERDDTLRGSITRARAWWDLKYYRLEIEPKPESKTLSGKVDLHYEVLIPDHILQIDLQPPLAIEKIIQNGETLEFVKDGENAHLVTLKKNQARGSRQVLEVYYSGIPKEAKNPPWQGGVQWTMDKNKNHFIATSCQGLGASAWWPCKDHMYDKPDSMAISVTAPPGLMDVSNGRLRSVTPHPDGRRTFEWFVSNPINNYGVNMNIGHYVHFSDTFHGEKGILDLDFYVLPYNLEKAKEQFKQAKLMLRAFEHWFGPYPFYRDGYKLVETPYLGMEHQSSITYGNGFANGYRGTDLSGTGWGLKWDFIIIHESGHEWFANSISYKDIADMWVHESFTNYSENLFTEYYFGKKAGSDYVIGTRKRIRNDKPIIGTYNINRSGSGDMYYKGGNMLHTIRQMVNSDEKWRKILRKLNRKFYHKTVDGIEIEKFLNKETGKNLSKIFDQYLRDTRIPVLEYSLVNNKLTYRWINAVPGFNMPVRIQPDSGKAITLRPTASIKTRRIKSSNITVDRNYYVEAKNNGSVR